MVLKLLKAETEKKHYPGTMTSLYVSLIFMHKLNNYSLLNK